MPVRILVLRVDLDAPIRDRARISGVGGLQMKRCVTIATLAVFAGLVLPGTQVQFTVKYSF